MAEPRRAAVVARLVFLRLVNRMTAVEPAIGALERLTLEPGKRRGITLADILQREERKYRILRRPRRELVAREHVRLLPAVHRVLVLVHDLVELAFVREHVHVLCSVRQHNE